MLYSKVGSLNIANIVLGGACFGGTVDEKTAFVRDIAAGVCAGI